MEYSVESIFSVDANGLHNITQWKKIYIYPTEKKRKSCFFYSTEQPLKPQTHPNCIPKIYISLSISFIMRSMNKRERFHCSSLHVLSLPACMLSSNLLSVLDSKFFLKICVRGEQHAWRERKARKGGAVRGEVKIHYIHRLPEWLGIHPELQVISSPSPPFPLPPLSTPKAKLKKQ